MNAWPLHDAFTVAYSRGATHGYATGTSSAAFAAMRNTVLPLAFLFVLGGTARADHHRSGHAGGGYDRDEHRGHDHDEHRGRERVVHGDWHGGPTRSDVAPTYVYPGYDDPGDVEIYPGYADPTFIDPSYVVTPRVVVRPRVWHGYQRADIRR